jgi:hypothetical protein
MQISIHNYKTKEERLQYFTTEFKKEKLSKSTPNLEAYAEFPIPIFILGMPRSGSSLIEQILASHSDVYGAGEIFCWPQTLGIVDGSASSIKQCIERIAELNSEELTSLGLKYLETIQKCSNGTYKYVSDKLPSNFWYIAMIRYILPQAIIIHSERDAMDTCFSCYQQNFVSGHSYIYKLENVGHYYNCYRELMQHWNGLYGDEIYNLNYEALIANQELETRKLLEHCKLNWQEACMSFHKTKRSVSTASAMQVRQPIYKQSVAKWRHYEQYLEPLLKTLKY